MKWLRFHTGHKVCSPGSRFCLFDPASSNSGRNCSLCCVIFIDKHVKMADMRPPHKWSQNVSVINSSCGWVMYVRAFVVLIVWSSSRSSPQSPQRKIKWSTKKINKGQNSEAALLFHFYSNRGQWLMLRWKSWNCAQTKVWCNILPNLSVWPSGKKKQKKRCPRCFRVMDKWSFYFFLVRWDIFGLFGQLHDPTKPALCV